MSFSFSCRSFMEFCSWLSLCISLSRVIICYYIRKICRKKRLYFFWEEVLGRYCMVDVVAGGVLLRFLAAASTISVMLSHGDCLSWSKAFLGMRGCMSNCRVAGDCIATSFSMCGLCCSCVGDRENTGGDIVTSRLAGADEVSGVILLGVLDAVVRPTAGIGVKILEGAGKKLRQSSWLSVPSMCLCVCSVLS